MLHDFETVTILEVLEYDGLIRFESGVAHTTECFQVSLADAARGARQARRHADLQETISQAMHQRYGKYLTEAEVRSLVDAMLPIAQSDPTGATQNRPG